MDKLSIHNEMAQFDRKNRDFYDELTDEEKKKFSAYLMLRWGSAVNGSRDMQEFYLISTNERLNKHFFAIKPGEHKKLQWLLCTTVSPGMGTQRHQWIAPRKKEAGATAIRKQLADMHPHLKDDELDLLAKITTKKDLDEYVKSSGQDIKK